MSPSTLTQTLLGSLLDSPAIVEVASQAGESVISVLRAHFTFTAAEITKAYQEGCGYAFVAISVGLDARIRCSKRCDILKSRANLRPKLKPIIGNLLCMAMRPFKNKPIFVS
ncbi:MAG: hypothetical protein VSS75_027575 [Candidatus Parabeggiatoa sp.]|nr:hypothetical protein [Candidatus Parabeggiatoa sp.]